MEKTTHNLRTFYILVLTQTFSLIGTRISALAIGIAVFQDTSNATPLALVAFFSVIPQILASNVAGVLADRRDRRVLMILSDAGQAFCTFLLLLSFASNSFQLWHLYTLTAIQAIFAVFQGPAFMASVTMLVPDSHRDRANAIQQLTGPASGIIAPTLAAVIYAAVGVTGAIMVDLGTFLVAMLVIFSVHIPRPIITEAGKAAHGTMWQEVKSGFQYLWTRKPIMIVLIYVSFVNFFLTSIGALSTPYLLARTNNNEVALGVIQSVMNIGMIAGGVLIGVFGGPKRRIFLIIPSVAMTGAMFAVFGTASTVLTLMIVSALMLIPLPAINAMFMSMMQVKIAPDMQGRVFSVIGQMSILTTPIGYLLVGPLADQVFEPAVGTELWGVFAPLVGESFGAGMGLMIFGGGISVLLLSIFVFSIPNVRRLELLWPDYVVETPAPEEPPHDVAPELGLSGAPL